MFLLALLLTPTIQPVQPLSTNAIAAVLGQNLATESRSVTSADMVDGRLPTKFAGVCVLLDGAPAPLFSVAPERIQFHVPHLTAASVAVQVAADCGASTEVRSNTQTAAVQAAAPEFFTFIQFEDGRSPIAAYNATTGTLVGKVGLLPGSTFAPARPGDIVVLYLTGLGETNPPSVAGQLAAGPAWVTVDAGITIGGTKLGLLDSLQEIFYIGATPQAAGLYQLNIRVPSVPDGDQPVVVTAAGVASASGPFLTIQK